ncbi:MAG: hypothetical protein PHI63_04975 [Patescibacteria group bacterium]|nr:hypothetical protein [Patescibacteria group bacterium]
MDCDLKPGDLCLTVDGALCSYTVWKVLSVNPEKGELGLEGRLYWEMGSDGRVDPSFRAADVRTFSDVWEVSPQVLQELPKDLVERIALIAARSLH